MITWVQLRKIMQNSSAQAMSFLSPLNQAMDEFGIDTPLRQAAFLAQVCHESCRLVYTSELASGSAYDGRGDLGNTQPEAIAIAKQHGSTPGRWWKGHGLIQITGFYNHKECGVALDLDLLHCPTLLAEPYQAARSAAWFWKRFNLNKWADIPDFDGVSDVINRGRKTIPIGDANGFADRLQAYNRARTIL